MNRSTSIALILALVMFLNFVAWGLSPRGTGDIEAHAFSHLPGITYSPYREGQDPTKGSIPNPRLIDEDFAILSGKVQAIRTYGSTKGLEVIPALAAKHGLRVIQTAWLDGNRQTNEAEINELIASTHRNPNVEAVLVGNEVVYRGDLADPNDPQNNWVTYLPAGVKPTSAAKADENNPIEWEAAKRANTHRQKQTVEELIKHIDRVKKESRFGVPVSASEQYHVYLEHPKLAEAVDFIAIHVFPYWEGKTVDEAVTFAEQNIEAVRKAYPNKEVVVTEIGWPSGGEFRLGAVPSAWNQEQFVREFVSRTMQRRYFIFQAFDEPWKGVGDAQLGDSEGSVGAHWGLWDKNRHAKFDWEKPSYAGVPWMTQWLAATAAGMILSAVFIFRYHEKFRFEGLAFFCVMLQAAVSVLTYVGLVPTMAWLTPSAKLLWILLFPAQLVMMGIVIIQAQEVSEMLWVKRWRRRFEPHVHPLPANRYPMVSLHIACCNEPPHMVIRSLESLAALDYPNLEVLVIDNNTSDESKWRPLEAWCAQSGVAGQNRFRFFHLEKWPGYKAGALNFALTQTAPEAQVVGVLDADYIVKPEWLREVMPYFNDPKVGLVQGPQDHRSWKKNAFKEMMNWEYRGFFHIGMVHRNEYDAIIQHGTMCLIRKSALEQVGRWGEWCICEDAELGLRLMQHDYETVYMEESYGFGVVPDTLAAYKKQRFRWAYGAIQILRGHWKSLLPWSRNGLSLSQKYHFIAGWLPWLGDALHLVFTLLLLLGTAALVFLPRHFMMPIVAFLIPPMALAVFNIVRSVWLYKERVACTWPQRIGACIAGLGLTYTIGRACLTGLVYSGRPFYRTPKCEKMSALWRSLAMARDEMMLLALLWSGIAGIVYIRGSWQNPQTLVWMTSLALQSIPYLAAVVTAVVAGTNLQSLSVFAGPLAQRGRWTQLEARRARRMRSVVSAPANSSAATT